MAQGYAGDASSVTKRRCPYCPKVAESRGLYAHVMNSEDEAHGDYRAVPDGFEVRKAEIVEEESPDEGEAEPEGEGNHPEDEGNYLYLCTWCGQMMDGMMGYKVHLSLISGDDVHPQDADVDQEMYARIPADENMEPKIPEESIERIRERELRDRTLEAAKEQTGIDFSQDEEQEGDADLPVPDGDSEEPEEEAEPEEMVAEVRQAVEDAEDENLGAVPVAELRGLLDRFEGKGEAYEDAGDDVEDLIARHS